jgi:hypothetical protein
LRSDMSSAGAHSRAGNVGRLGAGRM